MKNEILYQLKQLEGQYFNNTNSKAGKWLHYKLLRVEEGQIDAELEVREEMCNPNHMLHGGMIAMISDELCGLAFFSSGASNYYTTVNLSIDYLYSAPVGEMVIAKSKVLRSGKKIANVECSIYNLDNTLIAHATSNLVNTGKSAFALLT